MVSTGRRFAEILEAAERVGDRLGHEGLTMRSIAAEAGVVTTALYSEFGNKQGILEALNSRIRSELARFLDSSVEIAANMGDRLLRCCSAYVEFGLAHPWRYACAFGHDETSVTSGRCGAAASTFVDRAARYMDGGPKAREKALSIWVALHGLVTALLRDDSRSSHESLAQPKHRFMQLYLRMLLRGSGVPRSDDRGTPASQGCAPPE